MLASLGIELLDNGVIPDACLSKGQKDGAKTDCSQNANFENAGYGCDAFF